MTWSKSVQDRLVAACDMVGRSGARSLELGYHPAFDEHGNELDEATTPAHRFRWWAKATYQGAVLAVDDGRGPIETVEALAARVQKDARCGRCGRLICWGGTRRRYCWWRRTDGRWEPGCDEAAS
ncbi:MAG TPA: hypothetical protein VGR26_14915 [Acidimicrobiales bacterium]|nr:hypothetical protein [Acidimicrobiales bacterium]